MISDARQPESHQWIWPAAFLALHAICLAAFHAKAAALSCLFLTLAPVCACLAIFWRARHVSLASRRYWTTVGTGMLLWAVASGVSAYEQLVLDLPGDVGAGSQILYFLYGVPLLLAICSPVESVWGRSFVWLDGLQISLLGFLIYVTIFSVVPFSHQPVHPVRGDLVVLTFNTENFLLAFLAMVRFVAASAESEQRHAHRSLFVFLSSYGVLAAVYNHLSLTTAGPLGSYDLLIDLPFLYLAFSAIQTPRPDYHAPSDTSAGAAGLLLENVGPVLFPTSILALAVAVARHHYRTGICCTAAALLVYATRSSILQIRFQRGQAEAREARDSMEVLSLTDALTGVPNRRRFDDLLASEQSRRHRQQEPLSLLLIDIDFFKLLNDRFGHNDGDVCLRQVAHALQASLRRASDSLCRYGGEEFACLLPGTDRAGAEIVASRMRATIRSLRLRTETPIGEFVTVSIGVTTSASSGAGTGEDLIRAADRALYRAKDGGRDRVEFGALCESEVTTDIPASLEAMKSEAFVFSR